MRQRCMSFSSHTHTEECSTWMRICPLFSLFLNTIRHMFTYTWTQRGVGVRFYFFKHTEQSGVPESTAIQTNKQTNSHTHAQRMAKTNTANLAPEENKTKAREHNQPEPISWNWVDSLNQGLRSTLKLPVQPSYLSVREKELTKKSAGKTVCTQYLSRPLAALKQRAISQLQLHVTAQTSTTDE